MAAPRDVPVPVVTAAQAAALDARTIATTLDGDGYALMRRAGERAAAWIAAHLGGAPRAAVCCGAGNNGGDGWVIAAALREAGWQVGVHAPVPPRTDDARRARAEAEARGPFAAPAGDEPVVIDALLGTGSRGAVRAPLDGAHAALRARAAAGATIVAVDLPSGLDATTGEAHDVVAAHVTLTFGSARRGQLVRRDLVGDLVVLDIGLVAPAADVPRLVTAAWARATVPRLPIDAYKGTRGRLRIVGGDAGMAGAAILAARGAHASGAGMVRCTVAPGSLVPLQVAVPFATVEPWHPDASWPVMEGGWPHAVVIGPGLDGGVAPASDAAARVRAEVARQLAAWRGPVLLDGGALTAFAGRADDLAAHLDGRPALLTPHAGEFARLAGGGPIARFDDPARLAAALGATVLFKGVPTVVAAPDGRVRVVAAGTPALAVGGSGDLLAGIAGALLAQGLAPVDAGALAAWAHGTAAEHATARRHGWRGTTLDDVLAALQQLWGRDDDDHDDDARDATPPVLAALAAGGGR